MEYEIRESRKQGFNSKESYIVTRGRTSFLRVVGEHPSYDLMTATASEDGNDFIVCNDKVKLLSAALQLASEVGVPPVPRKDRSGREFLYICSIHLVKPDSLSEVHAALGKFFKFFDAVAPNPGVEQDEMRQLYSDLAVDDSLNDVYLSDGIWLSSDGSLHDRGR